MMFKLATLASLLTLTSTVLASPTPVTNERVKVTRSELAALEAQEYRGGRPAPAPAPEPKKGGEHDSEVHFTNTWPDKWVGGESYHMSWEGSGSGYYTFAWVEEYNGGDDIYFNVVFENEKYNDYDFYFAKCWEPKSNFRFIVYDSQGYPLPVYRADGPKLDLVQAYNEPDVC